jgi:high-affinity iron transporter
MKVFEYFSIKINSLKISYLLVLFFFIVCIPSSVSPNGNFNTLDTKVIKYLLPGFAITPHQSWLANAQIPDDQITSTNDLETDNQLPSSSEVTKSKNANLAETQEASIFDNLQDIRAGLNQFLVLYKNQQVNASIDLLQSTYNSTYQKIFAPINSVSPDISLALETRFIELFDMVNIQESYNKIVIKVEEIDELLDTYGLTSTSSANTPYTPTIAFASSFSIIFREGLEASIILGAIITYLEASRNERFKKYVYLGIVIAIVTTLGIWFLLDYALQFSGIDKDLLKGIVGMAAVGVLFWVSFWALNKMESKRWVEFIKSRVGKAATTGSVMIFILISYFTVFREGIETVIFYQSFFGFTNNININAYIISGLALGIIVVITIAILIKRIMKKLPLRGIFSVTMGIGAFMSVAFIGNAVRSFQEAGYIQTTSLIGTIPILDPSIASVTGIHPTLESLLAQIVLTGIYLIGLILMIVVKPKEKKISDSKLKS